MIDTEVSAKYDTSLTKTMADVFPYFNPVRLFRYSHYCWIYLSLE